MCPDYASEDMCRFKMHTDLLFYAYEWILLLLIKNTEQDCQMQLPKLLFHLMYWRSHSDFSNVEFS